MAFVPQPHREGRVAALDKARVGARLCGALMTWVYVIALGRQPEKATAPLGVWTLLWEEVALG